MFSLDSFVRIWQLARNFCRFLKALLSVARYKRPMQRAYTKLKAPVPSITEVKSIDYPRLERLIKVIL
jgi:hypothetical protein